MSVHSKIKERWLLYQVTQKRDPGAYGELYDLLAPRIYRFIYFKVTSQLDAEDLTAEVFLKAWQHISQGREIKDVSGLLYAIARNTVIDFYRRRASQPTENIDDVLLNRLAEAGGAVEGGAKTEQMEKIQQLNEAQVLAKNLLLLKDEYREALTLRYIDDLSFGEVAAILKKSQVGARVLVHRALQALKKIVENQNHV